MFGSLFSREKYSLPEQNSLWTYETKVPDMTDEDYHDTNPPFAVGCSEKGETTLTVFSAGAYISLELKDANVRRLIKLLEAGLPPEISKSK
jgi:hypothetical protein